MKNAVKKIIAFVLAVMICISTAGFTTRSGASPWDGEGSAAVDSLRNYYSSVFVTGLDGRINEMLVNVKAMQGTFPDSAMLSVTPVPAYESGEIDAAVGEERARGALVAASYTFDIKMVDENGVEYQPTDGRDVYISFSMDQIANENLDTQVYHIAESGDALAAESLYTQTQNDTATVATGGFSYYTVEFTYGELCYVLQGGEAVPLGDVLSYVGIYGEIEAAYGSNDALFSISNEGGIWTVTSHEAFDTTEWLRVTVGGVEYEIVVTDDNTSQNVPVPDPNDPTQPFYSGTVSTRLDGAVAVTKDKYYYGDPNADPPVPPTAGKPTIVKQSQSTDTIYDFAAGLPLSTIFIDETKLGSDKGTFEVASAWSSSITCDATNLVSYNPSASAAGHLLNGTVNKLDGPLFSFTFEDAAILKDGTKANVKITYSNAKIFTDERLAVMEKVAQDHLDEATQQGDATEIAAAQAELAASYLQGTVALARGSTIAHAITDTRSLTTAGTTTGFSQTQVEKAKEAYTERINKYKNQEGLGDILDDVYNTQALGKSIDITYDIVDDAGKPINGNFIFVFVGINLDRDPYRINGNNAAKGLWWVNDTYPHMHFLSEQIAVTNSSIASDYIYVRANNEKPEDLDPNYNVGNGASGISKRTGFFPQVVEVTEDGVKKTKIISNGYQPKGGSEVSGNDGYYSSGFVTLATSGFTITGYGHCFGGGTMNTQAYGARRIWYRYTSKTGPNGNIQTTTEGNSGGALDDTSDKGTKSDILDPNTYVVPEGKTVIYTLTPDSKYQIAKLQVKNASGGMQEIKFNGEPLSTMQPGQYYQFRDAAGKLCTLTALDDTATGGIKFTLEMPYAQHDEEVRVQWERTDAEVTVKKKTVNNKTGSFPFKIRAWKNEYVTTYTTGTALQDAIDSVKFENGGYIKGDWYGNSVSTFTADELAAIVSGITLKEKIDVSGQGGKYLWKTDKKLSDVGLATVGSADDDDLFVNWETAGSAVVG
ncbi:MAG: hypothetical protein IKI49_06545, partial [Oscillospiraceae bacterium]|nr:hypothetical protein [Oscillospiraceae bacterium]